MPKHLWPNDRKLQIVPNLYENLWSKFARNYKSKIYRCVKLCGIGPFLFLTESLQFYLFHLFSRSVFYEDHGNTFVLLDQPPDQGVLQQLGRKNNYYITGTGSMPLLRMIHTSCVCLMRLQWCDVEN